MDDHDAATLAHRRLESYNSLDESKVLNVNVGNRKSITDSVFQTAHHSVRDDSGYAGSSATEKEIEVNVIGNSQTCPAEYSLGADSKKEGLTTYQRGCYNVDVEARDQSHIYVGTSYFNTFLACCSADRRNCPNCVSANGVVTDGNARWTCKLPGGDISCGRLFLDREALIGHLFTIHRICDHQHMAQALNAGALAENIVQPEYPHYDMPSAQAPSTTAVDPLEESRDHSLRAPESQLSHTGPGDESYNNKKTYLHPDPHDFIATASASIKALAGSSSRITQCGDARVFTCSACQHGRKQCRWIDGQSRCSSCQHCEIPCTLAVAGLDVACHLNAVLEELDALPASHEFRRLFTGIYTDYGPSIIGLKVWADYKTFILSENNPRILRTTIIAHQIQDFEQRALQGERLLYNSIQVHGGHAEDRSVESAKDDDLSLQPSALSHKIANNDGSSVMCRADLTSAGYADISPGLHAVNDPVSDVSSSDSLLSDPISTSDPVVDAQILHSAKIYTTILLHLVGDLRKEYSQAAFKARPGHDSKSAGNQGDQIQPATSRQSNGKRKLEQHARKNLNNSQNNRGGDDDDDDESSMRPPAKKLKQEVHDAIVSFACPFHKKDPAMYSIQNPNEEQAKRYQKCGSCLHRTIAAIKQHLDRRHTMPEHYCPICWQEFKNNDQTNDHIRSQGCEVGENPFTDRMTEDMFTAIKKKVRNEDAIATWYHIFDILFPGYTPRPSSPYTEGLISALHSFALVLFQKLGPRANQVYLYLQDQNVGPQLLPLHRDIIDRAFTFFASTIAGSSRGGPSQSLRDTDNLDSQPTLVNSASPSADAAMKPEPDTDFIAVQDTLVEIGSKHNSSGRLQDIAIADAISRSSIPITGENDTNAHVSYDDDFFLRLESTDWGKFHEELQQFKFD